MKNNTDQKKMNINCQNINLETAIKIANKLKFDNRFETIHIYGDNLDQTILNVFFRLTKENKHIINMIVTGKNPEIKNVNNFNTSSSELKRNLPQVHRTFKRRKF